MGWLLVATLMAVLAAPLGFAHPSPKTHHSHRRHHYRRHRVRRPSYQAHPTRERYQQIQQALADKGFMKQEDVDGLWGPQSTDALKQFQAAHKLPDDGKIDALTLIALGLGPKHPSSLPQAASASKPALEEPAANSPVQK